MITLTGLCREVNNWFEYSKYTGRFKIIGGTIDLSSMVEDDSIKPGQFFYIKGSVFNDGVHQYPASDLTDEVFIGSVASMAIPADFLTLLNEINAWMESYGEKLNTPYQSESFGGYSYSLKGTFSGGYASSENKEPWVAQFSSKLAKWRKLK